MHIPHVSFHRQSHMSNPHVHRLIRIVFVQIAHTSCSQSKQVRKLQIRQPIPISVYADISPEMIESNSGEQIAQTPRLWIEVCTKRTYEVRAAILCEQTAHLMTSEATIRAKRSCELSRAKTGARTAHSTADSTPVRAFPSPDLPRSTSDEQVARLSFIGIAGTV